MRPGDITKAKCPARLAHGGSSIRTALNVAIPPNTDLEYQIEMVSCKRLELPEPAKLDMAAKSPSVAKLRQQLVEDKLSMCKINKQVDAMAE